MLSFTPRGKYGLFSRLFAKCLRNHLGPIRSRKVHVPIARKTRIFVPGILICACPQTPKTNRLGNILRAKSSIWTVTSSFFILVALVPKCRSSDVILHSFHSFASSHPFPPAICRRGWCGFSASHFSRRACMRRRPCRSAMSSFVCPQKYAVFCRHQ